MFEWFGSPDTWMALVTLTALEIVLGIDNIIFIAILVGRLPEIQRKRARILGLFQAMLTRIGLLLSLAAIMHLTEPLLSLFDEAISGRDLILIGGGLFLLGKSTFEIHGALERPESRTVTPASASLHPFCCKSPSLISPSHSIRSSRQ